MLACHLEDLENLVSYFPSEFPFAWELPATPGDEPGPEGMSRLPLYPRGEEWGHGPGGMAGK